MTYQYTIPGIPRSKKNSQQLVRANGRWIPIPSKAYKTYEAMAGNYIRDKPEKPVDSPVEITCIYSLPLNKDGSVPKNKPDLTNLLEATHDILVKYGVIADDNIGVIVSVDGSRACYTNSEPATIITIRELTNEETCKDWGEGG